MIVMMLASCLTSDTFDSRYADAFCTYAQECEVLDLEGFSTLSECRSEVSLVSEDCADFDRDKAKACLDNVSTMTCEDGMSGLPRACNRVCP